jgi:hypothetical protein
MDTANSDARYACEWLATAVYSLMDKGLYEECAALFAEDGIWVRGEDVKGPAAIVGALNRRPADQITRHLITNVLVRVASDTEATGTAIFFPFRGALRPDGTAPSPATVSAGDLTFKFRRGADGWKIVYLNPQFVFKD